MNNVCKRCGVSINLTFEGLERNLCWVVRLVMKKTV